MKTILLYLEKYKIPIVTALLIITFSTSGVHAQTFEFSGGIYRIPFANGTEVLASRDHLTHSPVQNRIDMRGTGSPSTIVAAADGWIRWIDDTNTASCGACTASNNYVWIQHINGEWTKYTHFTTGSVTALNHSPGDWVCAGDALGIEGDIGAAFNVHLHFEVAVPNNLTNPFDTVGGFINGKNLIPVICGIPNNVFIAGQTNTAGNCDFSECSTGIALSNQTINSHAVVRQADSWITATDYVVNPNASVMFRAGNYIQLLDGFRVNRTNSSTYAFFEGKLGSCNNGDGILNCGSKVSNLNSNENTGVEEVLSPNITMNVYPNPFSDVATIEFNITNPAVVSLYVMDLQGRILREIDHENLYIQGKHVTNFNSDNLSNGTYVVVLTTENERLINKIVLFK